MRTWRLAAAASCCIACEAPDAATSPASDVEASAPAEDDASLAAALAAFEQERRAAFDPLGPRAWSHARGSEPWSVARLDGARAVGVSRGDRALVLLDEGLVERDRLVLPDEPMDVAVDAAGVVHVVSARGQLWHFVATNEGLRQRPGTQQPVPRGRDLVAFTGGLVATDTSGHALVGSRDGVRDTLADCHGPIALAHDAGLVAAACLFARGLVFAELDGLGAPSGRRGEVVQLAPFFSVDVARHGDRWRVAAGGIEDHALDRSDGAFGFVDPFVFVFDVTRCGASLCSERIAAIDVGDWGVVTPKWLDLQPVGDAWSLVVAGSGGDAMVTATLDHAGAVVGVDRRTVPAGLRRLTRLDRGYIAANPLLDGWTWIGDDGSTRTASADAAPRDAEVRLGEALFFTTAMTRRGDSEGAHSRFTCETCHFEGTVDGRIHYTGREDIHAATKPLLGLFVNRPHFSRALDRTLAVMVDNELAVANRLDPEGPRFTLSPDALPWLRELGITADVGPQAQRRALMRFFEAFDHEPSPAIAGRTAFTEVERAGAALFAEHCESCHQARLVTDDPSTRMDRRTWEALVFSAAGPIVWATDERMRTGVEPYVHREGARVTSLRRVAQDWPYLTNGSARSLDDVLARIQLVPERIHAGEGRGPRLGPDEVTALRAFLDLL
jgi:hypothetical protein